MPYLMSRPPGWTRPRQHPPAFTDSGRCKLVLSNRTVVGTGLVDHPSLILIWFGSAQKAARSAQWGRSERNKTHADKPGNIAQGRPTDETPSPEVDPDNYGHYRHRYDHRFEPVRVVGEWDV